MRLKRRAEFLRVAATRKKWVTPGFILQVRARRADNMAPNATARPGVRPEQNEDTASSLRIGFTVSRKVGNAVQRNRVKRRLRALVAEHLREHARGGFDLVFIGRRATLKRPWPKLVRDLLGALDKMGVARSPHIENAQDVERRKPE